MLPVRMATMESQLPMKKPAPVKPEQEARSSSGGAAAGKGRS